MPWYQSFSRYSITSVSRLSLVVLLSAFITLVGGSYASAASDFDNTIQQTGEVKVGTTNNRITLTPNWVQSLNDYCTTSTQQQIISDFIAVVNGGVSGSWWITETQYSDEDNGYVASFVFTTSPTFQATFSRIAPGEQWERTLLTGSNFQGNGDYGFLTINQPDYLSQPNCYAEKNGGTGIGFYPLAEHSPNQDYPQTRPYVSGNVNIIYPAGYQGEEYPGEATVPPSQQTPDMVITSDGAHLVEMYDRNFYTIDDVPFTCNTGLTPVVGYELWYGLNPNDQTLIGEGFFSPTGLVAMSIPININGDFQLVTWYSCGSNDLVFVNSSTLDFHVSEVPTSPYAPDLNIVSLVAFYAIIQDRNFNTFDSVPFTCNDGLTPVMYYELWEKRENADEMITSGVMSPTIPFEHQMPTNRAGSYAFVAWYSCGDFPEMQFDQSTALNFQINQYGGLVEVCSTDTFSGWLCSISQSFQIGIFSSTFTGIQATLSNFRMVNPTNCTTSWVQQANFEDEYIGVQNFPPELCQFANENYRNPEAPFNVFYIWVNVVLSGAIVIMMVFGIMALFGFNVRVSSPIGEGDDTGIRSDIATSSTISSHKSGYVGKRDVSSTSNKRFY